MRIGGKTIQFRRKRWRSRRRPLFSGGGSSRNDNRLPGGYSGSRGFSSPGSKHGSKGKAYRRKGGGFRFSKRKVWMIAVIVFIVVLVQAFAYVDRNMKKPLVQLAQIRVKQIATESLNEAITEQVASGQQYEDNLIDWKTDSTGKITGFMLNYKTHMEITSRTVQIVRDTLEKVSKLHESIPLGQAMGSPLVASFGPRVPIRIEPQSDVKVDLQTRRQDAGINSILVEVYLHIRAEVSVVVPFNMGPQAVETDIPISYLMVVGDVPAYYYDNKGNPIGENGATAPSIALPTQPQQTGELTPSTEPRLEDSETGSSLP